MILSNFKWSINGLLGRTRRLLIDKQNQIIDKENQIIELHQKLEQREQFTQQMQLQFDDSLSRLSESLLSVSTLANNATDQVNYYKDLLNNGKAVIFDYSYHPEKRKLPLFFEEKLSENEKAYTSFIEFASSHIPELNNISFEQPDNPKEPFWKNDWFPPLDAITLYCLLVRENPSVYLEVGSGMSTKFARRAISDHGLQTKIISVDPFPRSEIDDICDQVIRLPFEKVDLLGLFTKVNENDVVFIDNSHRSFQNSDVTVFFTEALPLLKKGVIWGIHDIFLPADYPIEWKDRFYNEQYLLMAYLLGGAGTDKIEIPVAYLAKQTHLLTPLSNVEAWNSLPLIGGGFWMRRSL